MLRIQPLYSRDNCKENSGEIHCMRSVICHVKCRMNAKWRIIVPISLHRINIQASVFLFPFSRLAPISQRLVQLE
jgi:hypothetical protein